MKLNFSGKIVQFIIHNHPLAYLLLILSIVVGIGSYIITPKQYNPEIVMPAFVVRVDYPGATSADVETFVTKELEETILDIAGVDAIQSRSFDGGYALVSVQFTVGFDPEDAKTLLRTKLSDHVDESPYLISQPHIMTVDPDSVPILTYGFTHPSLSQSEIREAVVRLSGELKHVSGVANINIHGGESRALHIVVQITALNERGISLDDVSNVLLEHNMLMPLGVIENGITKTAIEIDGRVTTADDVANMVIAPGVRLRDVASVYDGFSRATSYIGVLHKNDTGDITKDNTVFLSIAKRAGENSITVAKQVEEELAVLLSSEEYHNFQLTEYKNTATVAKESIQGLGGNLAMSIFIVGFVLFLFLGKRPAFLVVLAIPLTLGWVFFVGYLFGETINRITLFALILSLGLLVDSATVVIENIFSHVQQGDTAHTAVIQGVNEVGMGLLLSTVTSVIVFLPTSQISGMMGEYMGPLSIFVPVALIASLGIAYVLTPFVAFLFIRKDKSTPTFITKKKSVFQQFFSHLSAWYATVLAKLLRSISLQRLFIFGVFGLLMVMLLFPLFQLVHFKMLPTADKNQFYVYVDAADNTDLERTAAIAHSISTIIAQDEEVLTMQLFVGEAPVIDFNGLFKSATMRNGSNQATIRVNLTHKDIRRTSSEDIVFALRDRLHDDSVVQQMLAQGVRITVLEDPPGPPVQATFVAKIQGPDTPERKQLVSYVYDVANHVDGLVDVRTSVAVPYLTHSYSVDTEKANAVGVSVASIQSTLYSVLHDTVVGQYYHVSSSEPGSVIVRTTLADKDSRADIADVRIKSDAGAMVPITSLLIESQHAQRDTLYRDDARPTVYITGEMQHRSIVYASIDAIRALVNKQDLPFAVQDVSWNLFGIQYILEDGTRYNVQWGGEWEMTLENFRDLGLAMLFAFFLIFAVLVAQFRSFKIPLLIIVTIPLAFIGILPGFLLLDVTQGTYLTATSLIGFIALMGIVVNNAILLLENINQEREAGASIFDALITAGRNRLRPILLTSLTTVLGSLTIIGDPVWSGFAWAIVFGLSLSAVLTLGVFPVLYLWFVHEGTDTTDSLGIVS